MKKSAHTYWFMFYFLKLSVFLANLSYFLFFRRRKLQVDFSQSKILFNRMDRIGDAIITLPLFLALKKKKINFKVLCSQYNKWVLEPFVDVIEMRELSIKDFRFSLISWLHDFWLCILSKFLPIKKKENFVFIDLKKDFELSEKYKNHYQIHFKSFLLNLKYSDYVIDDFYVLGGDKQLLEKYIMIFKDLEVDSFPFELKQYITKNRNLRICDLIKSLDEFIIIFTGNKRFRNFSKQQWQYLIENISYKGKILIIDDPDINYLNWLEQVIKGDNFVFLKRIYDLWTLMYLAMHSRLVVGIDGGGFNFLQTPTNAFEIFFYVNHKVWRPYSKHRYKTVARDGNHIIEKTVTDQNLNKYIYYVKGEKKVIYELLQQKGQKVVDNINLDFIVRQINKILNSK